MKTMTSINRSRKPLLPIVTAIAVTNIPESGEFVILLDVVAAIIVKIN
jgi:hypothetical protein